MDLISQGAEFQSAAAGYRVLARKYRPQNFEQLIGQEPMVRTLTNSFSTGRIAQAWIFTGVRGVGKTTTARILARALNYDLGQAGGSATVDMPEFGIHCASIMESRHVDVLEMDAASRTGIDDVREIVDGVRYAPASARYKVYIIDEVHMLSEKAFNAFLKTLEEPPPHVKFVFATTEIRKVPVTVLSRCQRFNLRRIESPVLVRHLARIAEQEGVTVEEEALAVIARAAEGSVRDALSLLDQAIAHGGTGVRAGDVRAMLGLTDGARIVELFGHVMAGEVAEALAGIKAQCDEGADPASVLGELAEFAHLVTRIKLVPKAAEDPAVTEVEREAGRALSEKLSMPVLARAWQMLLKGIAEVQIAQKPEQAADMVIVRIACAADLPTPEEALRVLKTSGSLPSASPPASASGRAPAPPMPVSRREDGPVARAYAAPAPAPASSQPEASLSRVQRLAPQENDAPGIAVDSYAELVALAEGRRDLRLKFALERQVRLLQFEDGRIEFVPTSDAPSSLAGDITKRLLEWTGRRWAVSIGRGDPAPTLFEQEQAASEEFRRGVGNHPQVRAVLERFPGAVIVDVKPPPAVEAPPGVPDDSAGEIAPDDLGDL